MTSKKQEKQISKEQKKSLEVPTTAKHNLNLALRSCFVLSRRDQRKRVKRRWKAPDTDSVVREFEVEVKSSERLPWFRDNELLMVFITIAQREGSQEIGLSEYELLKWMGLTFGKENYEGLRAAIDRLASVTLRGTLWEKDEDGGHWREYRRWDHLVYAADLVVEKDPKTGVMKGRGLKVKLGDIIWNDIASGNLLTFDWTEYRKLKGDSVKALYLYVQAIRVNQWEVDIFQLAETHLGMRHYKYPSRVWEKLRPILEAATKQGVIFHYERVKHGKYTRIRLRKAPKQLAFDDELPLEEVLPNDTDHFLLGQLKKRGVSHQKAVDIADDPPVDAEARLEYFDTKSGGNNPPKNPAAWLVWLMQSNEFEFPSRFKTKAQRQAEEEKLKQEQQEHERQRAAEMAGRVAEREKQRQRQEAQLKALIAHYSSSAELDNVWSSTIEQLAIHHPMAKNLHLRGSRLLSTENNHLVIWLELPEFCQAIETAYQVGIYRSLAQHLNADVNQITHEFITPNLD